MDEKIGIGIIIGLITASTIAIWNSEYFTKSQKIFLTVCCLFAPAQWLLAILIYYYNKSNSSLIIFKKENNNININKLELLKESGLLSETEFNKKIEKIEIESKESNIKETEEYKALFKLRKSGILDEEEFKKKIDILLSNEPRKKSQSNKEEKVVDYKSINNFKVKLHDVIIPKNIKSELKIDNSTLVYMFDNPNRYIKYFKNEEFPFFCALVLDREGYKMKTEQITALNSVAQSYFHMSGFEEKFNEMKNKYSR